MRYYQNLVLFAFRDLIGKLIKRYIEYVADPEMLPVTSYDIETISKVMAGFEQWLYRVTTSRE